MQDLKHRQERIQAKRKGTPWREFVMEICSWHFLTLYKRDGHVCRYPDTYRRNNVVSREEYARLGSIPTFEYGGVSFFDDLQEFFFQIPKEDRLFFYGGNENIEYTDGTFGAKNAYLSYEVGTGSENVCYSNIVYDNCIDVFSSQSITDSCTSVYSSLHVTKGHKVFYSRYIHNCSSIYFSTNLTGCTECIACDSLQNMSYCYQNKPLAKDEYLKVKKKVLSQQGDFEEMYKKVVTVTGNCIGSSVSSGSALFNVHGVEQGYYISNLNHGRNTILFQGLESSSHIYDVLHAGDNCHHVYASSHSGCQIEHVYCSTQIGRSSHIYYSFNIEMCSYCLGCTGLKNKSYCIFNKQYTKEDRYEKVDEIFGQMQNDGTLGNFFPGSMNPFYFNDTVAYLIDDSFTKQEVEAKGYLWRDETVTIDIPEGLEVVKVSELEKYEGYENGARTIKPGILKKVIQDESGSIYRIVKMEYDFLVKHGLPLPRKHWLERMKMNFIM